MKTETFLEKVLSGDGYYCMFASRSSDSKRVQKFYTSISAVLDAAHTLDADGYDAYFALSTFEEDNSRKVDNAKQLKSFFLDLDCGVTKDYPDQNTALSALRQFCTVTKLPKPLIVNSGRGVHAYWLLDEAVGKDDWIPIAERLKRLCAQHNLFADPAVTSDAARVLRIPGTHNHKGDPPHSVGYFGDVGAIKPISLERFSGCLGIDIAPPPSKYIPSGASAVMDALMGNKTSVFKDILDKTLRGAGCAQLGNLIRNQAEVPEPLWRAGLSIAKFCEDGDKAARAISRNHPDYNQYETAKKMDFIKGPYRCATFDEYAPEVCTSCPHWGKIKSPIVLGGKIREASEEDNIVVEAPALSLPNNPTSTYVIPKYPHPYFRGANGGVYTRITQPEGEVEEVLVYHHDLYVVRRINDPETGEAVVMRLHMPHDGVKEFTVPMGIVTSRDEFRKALNRVGVAVVKVEPLMGYTMDWIKELHSSVAANEARKQFGWTDDTMSAFVLGNQEILADKIEFNPPSSQTGGLFASFEPKGTFEAWKETINFYNRDGFELHQYMVGTGFGSALMKLSAISCAAMHVYSKDSGVGKTTAMLAGMSIWGDPKELVMFEKDTHNTKMHRGEVYHNLPLYIDEVTNSRPKELSDFAYQVTGGRQRARMHGSTNAERYRGEPWQFLSVTTGNLSVIEKISLYKALPKAEAQRVLEVKADRLFKKSQDKAETDAFSKALEANYGHAGPVFVQHVMANLDAVKRITAEVQAKVDAGAQLTSENRFWSAHVTHTLTGLIFAKKLGLVDYDIAKIFKFAIQMLKLNLNAASDMSTTAQEVLNDYINEHWNNVLWIKSTDDLRKGESGALDSLIVPEALPRGQLVARYETDIKRAYLIPKPFRAWCAEQQINYGSVVQDLMKEMGAKKRKMRLSKGTHMQLPPTEVLMVDCSIEALDDAGDTKEGES